MSFTATTAPATPFSTPRGPPIARSRRSTAGTRCLSSSMGISLRRPRPARPDIRGDHHVLLHRREGQASGQRQGAERLDADRHRQRLLRSPLPRAARSRARHRLHQRSGWRARARRGGTERGVRARAGCEDPCRLGQRRSRARQGGAPRRGAGSGGMTGSARGPDRGTAMTVMTRTRFDVVSLSKHIGAEIRGLDLREKPDDETVRAIYQAWLDHLVIVFPDQKLSQEDLIRATGYFGELGELSRPPKYFPKGYSSLLPGIILISNIRENGE